MVTVLNFAVSSLSVDFSYSTCFPVGNQLTKQCCVVLTVLEAFGWATQQGFQCECVCVFVRISHLSPFS